MEAAQRSELAKSQEGQDTIRRKLTIAISQKQTVEKLEKGQEALQSQVGDN